MKTGKPSIFTRWARAWMERKGLMESEEEADLKQLLKQQQELQGLALRAYIDQRYSEWKEINRESERISRRIAEIEQRTTQKKEIR